jgi:hypothetical protein
MDVLALAEKAASLSGAALSILALFGALKGWWVPRWLYDRETRRADSWETLYHRERSFSERLLPAREATP